MRDVNKVICRFIDEVAKKAYQSYENDPNNELEDNDRFNFVGQMLMIKNLIADADESMLMEYFSNNEKILQYWKELEEK